MPDPRQDTGARFRFVCPTQKGPWRDNCYAALIDAVRAGYGSVEEWIPGPDEPPVIYLHPFADIEKIEAGAVALAA